MTTINQIVWGPGGPHNVTEGPHIFYERTLLFFIMTCRSFALKFGQAVLK